MSLLKVSGVRLQEEGDFVLKNISFTQQAFQKIAISGETGSGKSSLLKIIAGYIQPSAGNVFFEGTRVKGPAEKLVPGHPGIAYLSQQFELPKSLRVEQVLRYANTLSEEGAETLYDVCRISHLLPRRTDHLSGGERQRIALARLLTSSPRLLLLDEPYSNLDMGHKAILKSVVRDIGEELNITCTLISHDPLDTLSWADEILVMKAGQVLQQGTPVQIYQQPANAYIAGLFGNYNLLNPAQAEAFSRLPGIVLNGKNMLLRPEHIRLVADESQGVAGKVRQVSFFGSYSELEVLLPKATLKVKVAESKAAKGDMVYMAVAPEDVWYI